MASAFQHHYSSETMKQRIRNRVSFTLLELMLVVAIIGVIAAIVIAAINPQKQISATQSVKRAAEANQLEKSLAQYMIDKGTPPDTLSKYSTDPASPTPICAQGASDTSVCINAAPLITTYLAAVPKDPTEPCSGVSGFAAYIDKFGPHVVQRHDTDLSTCPISVTWNGNNGTIGQGIVTLTADYAGKTITIGAGGTLNLNGHSVGAIVNSNGGTVVALGTETVTTSNSTTTGAWKITGNSNNLSVLSNQTNLSSLTLAPTASNATYTPSSALKITGNLTIGNNVTLDTTSANNSAIGSLTNNGSIVLGDNASGITFASYDSVNGNTIIAGTLVRPIAYHDLTINSSAATLSGTTNVSGSLTVNSGQSLSFAGNTLNANGPVTVNGFLSGQGQLTVGGGSTVTVGTNGSISGTDATRALTLSALQAWYLKYSGANPLALLNLNLHNSQHTGTALNCSGCTDSGGNGGISITPLYTWTGSADYDWNNVANWLLNGTAAPEVPPDGSNVEITATENAPYDDGSVDFSSMQIQIDAGAYLQTNGAIYGGVYSGNGLFYIYGTVSGGTFNVSTSIGNEVDSGTFNAPVTGWWAAVYGGIFNSSFQNNYGALVGGTYNGIVTCPYNSSCPNTYWCGQDSTCHNSCTVSSNCLTGYSCTSHACQILCGDGIVGGSEQCDDGNTRSGDGCSATCHPESGFVCTGTTPSVCHRIVCGDGIVDTGELCDDHNTTNGDGCSAACLIEPYWQCSGSPSTCHYTRTWLGGSGNWSDPSKWSGNLIPQSGEDVVIPGGVTVTDDVASSSPHFLTVNAGATLTILAGNTVLGALINYGTVNVQGTFTQARNNPALDGGGFLPNGRTQQLRFSRNQRNSEPN